MASLGITYSVKVTEKSKERAFLTGNVFGKDTMYTVGRAYLHYINFRVPKKSGALRSNGRVLGNYTGANVFWRPTKATAPYMHYQYVGRVYGPNKAKLINGQREWRSPYGVKKRPTNRMMGHKFTKYFRDGTSIEVKGYTTNRPLHTGPDWVNKFKKDPGKYGQSAVNIQAGRYIYEASCKLWGKKPVGGYQVWHRWRRY